MAISLEPHECLGARIDFRTDSEGRLVAASFGAAALRVDRAKQTGRFETSSDDYDTYENGAVREIRWYSESDSSTKTPFEVWIERCWRQLLVKMLEDRFKHLGDASRERCDAILSVIEAHGLENQFVVVGNDVYSLVAQRAAKTAAKAGDRDAAIRYFGTAFVSSLHVARETDALRKRVRKALDADAEALALQHAFRLVARRDKDDRSTIEHYVLAWAARIGVPALAEIVIDTVVELSTAGDVLAAAGRHAASIADDTRAERCFRRAMELAPADPAMRNQLVTFLLSRNRMSEAETMRTPSGASDPEQEYVSLLNEVFMRISRGELDGTLELAVRAHALEDAHNAPVLKPAASVSPFDPIRFRTLRSQGACNHVAALNALGRFDEARRVFELAIEAPALPARRVAGDRIGTQQLFASALHAYLSLGKDKKLDALLKTIAKAVPEPDEKGLAYNLACAHARRGDKTLARTWLDRALALGIPRAQAEADTDLVGVLG